MSNTFHNIKNPNAKGENIFRDVCKMQGYRFGSRKLNHVSRGHIRACQQDEERVERLRVLTMKDLIDTTGINLYAEEELKREFEANFSWRSTR
ncbi:MAG: hypothetical protein ACOC32_04130 [Nanoarchaeota archaeon]